MCKLAELSAKQVPQLTPSASQVHAIKENKQNNPHKQTNVEETE
jgi:hypothetical protein